MRRPQEEGRVVEGAFSEERQALGLDFEDRAAVAASGRDVVPGDGLVLGRVRSPGEQGLESELPNGPSSSSPRGERPAVGAWPPLPEFPDAGVSAAAWV
jgi:hypothetical protein